MKQVILDTSFIITCIKQKIDIFEELIEFKIIIPTQVLNEIKRITESKKKLHIRENAEIALKILNQNKFTEIDLKSKNTDKGIIKIAKQNKEILIATLDREIKNKTKNKKIIIRNKKNLEII